MSAISFVRDAHGIVVLTLDAPGEPVNTMNRAFQVSLRETVERLERELADVKGVVFISGKSTFFAGGDLRSLMAVDPNNPGPFFDEIQAMKGVLRRLEKLGRPVVAAINGSALGGGLELALSCHHRVCLEDPKIQIGLPEATLGLLPGAGGVVKSVRLMGLEAAIPYIAEGKRISPSDAKSVGYVDALAVTTDGLMDAARKWIDANPHPIQLWDDPHYRIPHYTGFESSLDETAARIRDAILARTHGNYPAPIAVLDAAVEGLRTDFDTAMTIESRYLTQLAVGSVAKSMITTSFFGMTEIRAARNRPADIPKRKASRAVVVGASEVAGRWVAAFERRSIACVRVDSLDRLDRQVLEGCDVAVEATGDRAIDSRPTLNAIAANVKTETLVITASAGDSVARLAKDSGLGGRLVGAHLFGSTAEPALMEIVRPHDVTDERVAAAFDLGQQLGALPVIVADARDAYVRRLTIAYVQEGMALLGDGIPAATVESAATNAGMATGPLRLADEVSLQVLDDMLHGGGHAHEASHGHAHGHHHDHGHDHDHDHHPDHDHDHHHAHAHEQGHAHDERAHAHGHEHAAGREPAHDHGHVHDREHAHDREHVHAHGDAHRHGHGHEHGHDHGHADEHAHAHAHGHTPDHEHAHADARHHTHDHDGHGRRSNHEHSHDHRAGGARAASSQGSPPRAVASAPIHDPHGHRASVAPSMPQPAVYVLEKMAHGYHRMGRAAGRGFYEYDDDEAPRLWDGLKAFRRRGKELPVEELRDRLLYAQALEAVRCLQEGVVKVARDANVASILGCGFPSYTGGAVQFVNHVGVQRFVERAGELQQRYGERFRPPQLLINHASTGTPL